MDSSASSHEVTRDLPKLEVWEWYETLIPVCIIHMLLGHKKAQAFLLRKSWFDHYSKSTDDIFRP